MKPGWRVRRIADGSAILTRRIGRAFLPHHEHGDIRLLAATVRIAAGGYTGVKLLDLVHHSPWWMAAGTCLWCAAAWRAEPGQQTEPEHKEQPGTGQPAYTDTEIREDAIARLRELIGTRNGVLIPEILTTWRQAGWLTPEVTGADLQRQFIARGIPVRPSLKVAGAVNAGIHRDDLPPLPKPLPDQAAAAAG